MADFVSRWAARSGPASRPSTTRAAAGTKQYITNPTNQLGGIWVDDANSAAGLPKTTSTAAPGAGNTYTDLAAEAARAVAHFGITDLSNANIIIAQPPNFSDPNALSTGYCAFHDYTLPGFAGGIYNGITPNISYTNMPYALAINSGGANVCGENAVNSGAAGKLDGFSIVLGHEIEETVTDPGAEDISGSGTSPQTYYGGWYDAADANENGDKCAWVGENLLTAPGAARRRFPGAMGNITGNAGTQVRRAVAVVKPGQRGTGYCAGAGTDSPLPNG